MVDTKNSDNEGPINPKTVLITGGSFGLGLAMAQDFVKRGLTVYVCGRSADKLAEAKRVCPALKTIQCDITKAADRERLFVEAGHGAEPIDLFINNAAICHAHDYTSPFTLAKDRAREEIETNFAAPVELIRLYLARKPADRPVTLVNVSTPGAFFPLTANPLYASTKAGFHMFTLALREHMKGTNVRVIEVFPPAMATGLSAELDVASEEANGPNVVNEVAALSVARIMAGEENILPHAQSVQLMELVRRSPEAVAEMANKGVKRKAGWDREA